MTMHLEKDVWGEQFAHEVNGVRIFAMGGDYIPEDNLLGRVTKERTYELLKQARMLISTVSVYGAAEIILTMDSGMPVMNWD